MHFEHLEDFDFNPNLDNDDVKKFFKKETILNSLLKLEKSKKLNNLLFYIWAILAIVMAYVSFSFVLVGFIKVGFGISLGLMMIFGIYNLKRNQFLNYKKEALERFLKLI